MQSENTADTTDAPGGESAEPATLDNLAALLAADDVPETPGGDDGEAGGDADENAKPVKFNDLAGATELELDDLYNLKISYADGKEMTVEELKDLGAKQDDIVLRELQWEEQRAEQESKLRRVQNELTEIVQALPKGALNEQVLAQVRERQAEREKRELALTLDTIQPWRDESVREADMAGMVKHLESFGFPKETLGSLIDHRWQNFIRQSYLREQRIKAALAKVSTPKPDANAGKTVAKASNRQTTPTRSAAQNSLEAFFEGI